MTLSKQIAIISMLLSFCAYNNNADAQLWRYLNDSPAKEKAASLAVEREACSVKQLPIVVYGDTLSYKIITYAIQSFDNIPYQVTMSQKPFTKTLNISCGTDSLDIIDLMGMDSVHFLNKNLLELIYSPRGGSDDGFQNTMILCIEKGKLHVAMEIESDHQFDGPGLWGEYYLTAKFTGQSEEDYHIMIKTNDRYHSKSHPSKNHNLNAQFMIRFDSQKKTFYNAHRDVDAVIGDWEVPGSRLEPKINPDRVRGHYPAIVLGNKEYYYIRNTWYSAVKWFDGKIHLNSDAD